MELQLVDLATQLPVFQVGFGRIGDAFSAASGTIASVDNVVLLILATLMGLVFGALPGLGGTTAMALLIPLTFGMEPLVAFMILVAANGGTSQGGAITAILINTPGKAPNAATLLDGYPMARQGRAGEAIGASSVASGMGALVGISFLVLLLPLMLQAVLWFGAPQIFWLGLWGLTMLSVVVKGDVVGGLISGALGLLVSFHGLHTNTATVRWDYGISILLDGFGLIPPLIGLFAVAEMINLVSQGERIATHEEVGDATGGRVAGMKAVFTHRWIFLRSALIGTLIGTIPGVGGTAANYIAYFQAVQTSADPDSFGTGDIRGVIASEASNDGKEGGAYIPTLAFGVPGSASMAVLFGAFLLHGINPGPLLMQNHLDIVAVVVISAVIANLASSVMGIVSANQLTKVTRINITYIAPLVLAIAFFGSYAIENNQYAPLITVVFGILGYVMIRVNVSRIPMILGIVLGPIIETNFHRGLQIGGRDPMIFFTGTVNLLLIALIIVSLLVPVIRRQLRKRTGLHL